MFLLRVAEVTAPSESDLDDRHLLDFTPTFAEELAGPAVEAEGAESDEAADD